MVGVYLDYNACAPLKLTAREKMIEMLKFEGNAASVHKYGRRLSAFIEEARQKVARALEAKEHEIVFTSCGSEANNLAIRGFADRNFRILVCASDHLSTLQAVEGAIKIPVDRYGLLDLGALETLLKTKVPTLVSVHMANNESGVIQPLSEIVKLVKTYEAFIHIDAIQAVGRIPVNFHSMGVDTLSVASSKVGGPSGAAALIIREIVSLPSLIKGGGQEKSRRAGTQNTAAIVGFASALEEAIQEDWTHVESLRDSLELMVKKEVEETEIYGASVPRLPNTSLMRLPGVHNELQLMHLDLAGYAISAGSACSSGKVTASHVLLAMGIPEKEAREAIRVSLCPSTTSAEIHNFVEAWLKIYSYSQQQKAA
jgi:cysteine desulfurase